MRAGRTTGWSFQPRPACRRCLNFLSRLDEAEGGAVALGVDLPIGLPRAYAATRPEPDFPPSYAMLDGCRTSSPSVPHWTIFGRTVLLPGPWHRRHDPSVACACTRPTRRVGAFPSLRPGDGGAAGRGTAVLDTGREPVREGRDRRLEAADPAGTDDGANFGCGRSRVRFGLCCPRLRSLWRKPTRPRHCVTSASDCAAASDGTPTAVLPPAC